MLRQPTIQAVPFPRHTRMENLTGKKIGRWRVLCYLGKCGMEGAHWLCACDCGTIRPVYHWSLSGRRTKSCRCLMRQIASTSNGMHATSEYKIWGSIKQRAANPNHRSYCRYGGIGRGMCARWQRSFLAFYADMGPRPSKGHSIDRIDNALGYTCGKCSDCKAHGWRANCRWATAREQVMNRSNTIWVEFGGERKTLPEWSKATGIKVQTLYMRRKKGWSPERMLTTPYAPSERFVAVNGREMRLFEAAKAHGISPLTLRGRLERGVPITKALTVKARPPTTHGHTRGGSTTPEYRLWSMMLQRCYNPNFDSFAKFGGRGIGVCSRWRHSFEHFLADLGARPSPKHHLSRRDTTADFSPENCCWDDDNAQAWRRTTDIELTCNGRTRTVAEWARETGVQAATLYMRHKRGWPDERVLTAPVRQTL